MKMLFFEFVQKNTPTQVDSLYAPTILKTFQQLVRLASGRMAFHEN